jgi:hypothetical protein
MHRSRRPLPLHRLARMSQPSRDPPTGLRMADPYPLRARVASVLYYAIIAGAMAALLLGLGLVRLP